MSDERLVKLLEEDVIDVPKINFNAKKIIAYCEYKTREKTKKKRLILSISSFLLFGLIILSLFFVRNSYYSSVRTINKSIDNLGSINDNKAKIQEIMMIYQEIQTLPVDKQEKVHTDMLTLETKITTASLKNAASWNGVINKDVTYFTFNDLINTKIVDLFVKKGLVSNTTIRLSSNEFTDSLLAKFYLPYIDIIDNIDSFYEDYKVQLSGDTNDFCSFQINDYNGAGEPVFNIYVYGSGYILVTQTTNNEVTKAYISLYSLDYLEFKSIYGAYSITSDFYFNEVVLFDNIQSISVTESTYWALQGMPGTFISDDQMFDFYNDKLKNLRFTEDDELVKIIQNELGSTLDNDTSSITIALNDNDSVSIFISKTTHRFTITHGMMTYAGVGTIEYEL